MSHDLISRSSAEDGVVTLTLRDIQGKNALSKIFVETFLAQLTAVGDDPEARVCLIRGSDEVFCSGADKQLLRDLASGGVAPADILLSRAILAVPIPTIAAMEGHAVGGGLAVGICCDIVLMARESRYGCSFLNMGFTPGMGLTQLLPQAVGDYLAAEMLYGGQFLRGTHFAGRGGINYVLPRAEVLAKAKSLAARIADKPRGILEMLKRTLASPKRLAFEQAHQGEATMHEFCFSQPETRRRIEENFVGEL